MRKVFLDLAHSVEPAFKAAYGVAPQPFFSMLLQIAEETEDRLNDHIAKIRKCATERDPRAIIAAYNDAFPGNMPITGEQASWMWEQATKKRQNLLALLMMHADLKRSEEHTSELQSLMRIS